MEGWDPQVPGPLARWAANKVAWVVHGCVIITLYWSVLALCRKLVWIQHSGLHMCIQKSGIRLGLVCFSFKELGAILRMSQGLLRHVDVEGVA